MMWARVIFSFILLQASALFPADNNDSHTAEFYQQLCGFDSFSPARIDFLKSFITVHPSFLTAYEFLFEAFVQINQLDAADAYFSRLEKAGNPAGASWMLARLAVFQGDLNKADKLYRLALSSDISNHSPALDYLAFDAKNNNAFHTAEYLQSLDLPPADLIFYRACSKYNRGEYQSADSLFGGLGLTIDDLQRWHYQGLADYYQSQLVQADSLFRIGLRRAQEMQDIYHQALFSYNLAYTAKTEPERVIAQARRLAESINAVQLLNKILKFEAYLQRRAGLNEAAAENLNRALETALKFQQSGEIADLYYQLALTEYHMSMFSAAIKAAQNCLSSCRSLPEGDLAASSHYLIGLCYRELNSERLASSSLRQALALAQKHHLDDLAAEAEDRLFLLQQSHVSPSEYIAALERVISKNRRQHQEAENNYYWRQLGWTWFSCGEIDSSARAFQQALLLAQKSGSRHQILWCMSGLNRIALSRDDTVTAARLTTELLTYARQQKETRLAMLAHGDWGEYYLRHHRYEQAADALSHAILCIEELRHRSPEEMLRLEFLAFDRSSVYEQYCECLHRLYRQSGDRLFLEKLYVVVEQQQARLLKEHRPDSHLQPKLQPEYASVDSLQAVQRRIRSFAGFSSDAEWEQLLDDRERLKDHVFFDRLTAQRTEGIPSEATGPSLSSLQEKLAGKSVILYHLTSRDAFALVIQQATTTLIDLPRNFNALRAEIDSLIFPLHHVKAETVKETPFYADIAFRLYQQLMEPIEKAVRLDTLLFIVPGSVLINLPFELLLAQKPLFARYLPVDAPEYAGAFLVHRYAFCYAPSTHLLRTRPPTHTAGQNMLIVANPFAQAPAAAAEEINLRLRTGWSLQPLPFAETEARRIKKLLRRVRILKNESALESEIKRRMGKYNLLHFASHAFIDTTDDAFSGLILAPDQQGDDGILMGFEIDDIPLDCDLVTLSACETGRGRLVAGEGVTGLPRQFLASGAQSVIMSNWKVDDSFTSLFMPQFYQHYRTSGDSKAEALRKAKQAILFNDKPVFGYYYHHPFFWASFTLYGRPEGVVREGNFPIGVKIFLAAAVGIVGLLGVLWRRGRKRRGEEVIR